MESIEQLLTNLPTRQIAELMANPPKQTSQSGTPDMERRPTIMTLEEVAKYLRVHKSTIYRMAREGTIPSTKVANQWRFKKARIDAWLLEREKEKGLEEFQA